MMIATSASLLTGYSAPPLIVMDDLERAKTKLPRLHLVGNSIPNMLGKMNTQLVKSAPLGLAPTPCAEWSLESLESLLATLHGARDPAFEEVYQSTTDNRRMRAGDLVTTDLPGLQSAWAADRKAAQPHGDELIRVARDARCYDAAMWWVHHVPYDAKERLVSDGAVRAVPLLPIPSSPHVKERAMIRLAANTSAPTAVDRVYASFKAATGCAACHVTVGENITQDCQGTPDGKCPVWPRQFSAPFGLHSGFPTSIGNASSTFYYKFMEGANETQAQLVDYSTRCFPFVSARNFFESKPCKLLFIPSGIYLMQPALGIDCCTFVSGIGAVPPKFLRAYTYEGTNVSAPDLYGNDVMSDHWSGPDGFEYWTVSHFDSLYHNWGHDIVFQDGPTGVTWRWGNFDVSPQDDSLFQLPAGADCSKTCSKFLAAEHHAALSVHATLARHGA